MTEAIHFGTDGWRGIIADDFTFPNLRRAARAAAEALKDSPNKQVVIGYDRRFLSRAFAECAAAVFESRGYDVSMASAPMPTPAVSACVVDQKAAWGFVITASHNPALYNGFKVKDGSGRSAAPEITQGIESRLLSADEPLRPWSSAGKLFDFRPTYNRHLRSRLDWKLLGQMRGTVVFDHLHGVAAGIPESLLKKSRLRVLSLHASADPLFGGLHPEPIDPYVTGLQAAVRKSKALVGIALDGDADRLGVVDDRGRTLTPHQVFPLLVLHALEHKKWRGKVVQAVSLGYLSQRIAKSFGCAFEEVPVGFKHVAERMLGGDVLAGGEESGGYALRGGLPERDGILNGLLFLEMIAARGKKPSQLVADLEKRFGAACFRRIDLKLREAIRDREGFVRRIRASIPGRLAGRPVVEIRDRDGIKIVRDDQSWLLLRPSGTEPLLRTYAESASAKETDRLLQWARGILKDEIR